MPFAKKKKKKKKTPTHTMDYGIARNGIYGNGSESYTENVIVFQKETHMQGTRVYEFNHSCGPHS